MTCSRSHCEDLNADNLSLESGSLWIVRPQVPWYLGTVSSLWVPPLLLLWATSCASVSPVLVNGSITDYVV